MSISVYDVNNYLKNDATLQQIAGKKMSIMPVVSTDKEKAPYIVYFYSPFVSDVEAYWLRHDSIRYTVFDLDVDRLFKISDRIVNLLSIGNGVNEQNGILSANYRILSSWQVGSNLVSPSELNGYYRMNLDFKMCIVTR